jgi:hypothetical protein
MRSGVTVGPRPGQQKRVLPPPPPPRNYGELGDGPNPRVWEDSPRAWRAWAVEHDPPPKWRELLLRGDEQREAAVRVAMEESRSLWIDIRHIHKNKRSDLPWTLPKLPAHLHLELWLDSEEDRALNRGVDLTGRRADFRLVDGRRLEAIVAALTFRRAFSGQPGGVSSAGALLQQVLRTASLRVDKVMFIAWPHGLPSYAKRMGVGAYRANPTPAIEAAVEGSPPGRTRPLLAIEAAVQEASPEKAEVGSRPASPLTGAMARCGIEESHGLDSAPSSPPSDGTDLRKWLTDRDNQAVCKQQSDEYLRTVAGIEPTDTPVGFIPTTSTEGPTRRVLRTGRVTIMGSPLERQASYTWNLNESVGQADDLLGPAEKDLGPPTDEDAKMLDD